MFTHYKLVTAILILVILCVCALGTINEGSDGPFTQIVQLIFEIAIFVAAYLAIMQKERNDGQIQAEKKKRRYSKKAYDAAFRLFKTKKYHEAIQEFSALLVEDTSSSVMDNCQYYVGAAYYELGDYPQAIEELNKVLVYPNSNKIPDTIFLLGQAYQKDGQKDLAKLQYEKLVTDYPGHKHSKRAYEYLNLTTRSVHDQIH